MTTPITIRRLNASSHNFEEQLDHLLSWESVSDDGVNQRVLEIIADVRARGDAALVEPTRRFDGLGVASMAELILPRERLQLALTRITPEQRKALETAAERVRSYHEKQKQDSWSYTEADGKVLDQIVDDFNKSQSQVTITTTTKTWAVIGDTLLPALSAKQGPDIVALPAENLPVYATKGAFVKLDDFYAAETTKAANLNPRAVDMVKVNGSYYGVPTGFVPLSVIYNKTLFTKAGITSFPTTWDEWVADAKKLTLDPTGSGTPEQYGLALPDHAFHRGSLDAEKEACRAAVAYKDIMSA